MDDKDFTIKIDDNAEPGDVLPALARLLLSLSEPEDGTKEGGGEHELNDCDAVVTRQSESDYRPKRRKLTE